MFWFILAILFVLVGGAVLIVTTAATLAVIGMAITEVFWAIRKMFIGLRQ
ncbi:MAG: hypothetical protein [Caudoviricetes sp.]|nr:MAG: hypothetical protein [Caudoviricetes sp.]